MATRPSLDDLAAKPDDGLTLKDIVNGIQDLKLSLGQRLTSIEMRLNEIESKETLKIFEMTLKWLRHRLVPLRLQTVRFLRTLVLLSPTCPGRKMKIKHLSYRRWNPKFMKGWSSQIWRCRLLDEQPLVPMPKLLWGKRTKMNGRAS